MKYIGYYDSKPNRRLVSPAAVDKMNYIANVASRLYGNIEILSCATCSSISDIGHIEKLSDSISVRYIKTRKKHDTLLGKIYDALYDRVSQFLFLMRNIKHKETVIVYHSLLNMTVIRLLKKIKKVKIILEVEEIYSDVDRVKMDKRDKEIKFLSIADAYIFPSEIMNEQFNKLGRKYAIIHGTYEVNNKPKLKFNDNKIHVVYAGTFESSKGGALIAVDSAQYLSNDYVLHILGFGTAIETQNVKNKIAEVNKKSLCEIIYEGKLTGNEYQDFISKCDIGLSSQNPKGVYNNTSFPSKILSYMCNGLKVVSVRIPVVESSEVKDGIWYYDNNDPRQLAIAIQSAKNGNMDTKCLIRKLDKQFERSLELLMI